MAACQACGVAVNAEVERIVKRMLAGLDDVRKAFLAETYQGTAPEILCAACMNVTSGVLNQQVAVKG